MNSALRDLPAWGISLVVNLSILVGLHFIVAMVDNQTPELSITSSLEEEVLQEEYNFSETTNDQIGNMGDTNSFSATATAATAFGPINDVPIEKKMELTTLPTNFQSLNVPQVDIPTSEFVDLVEIKGQSEMVKGGVEGVMDRLTLEIKRSLEERETLVIWLFDASGSLDKRRKAIAERFENVYKQLDKIKATDGLRSAVASFGKSAALLTPQVVEGGDTKTLVKAVNQIKVDSTGVENVFTAVRLCVEKYKYISREKRINKLIFIITDERGDDYAMLEDVINQCKQYHFRVFCVGNGSVFGQQKGYIRWTYEDGFEEDIPVDQGPESAFPQALQLPFLGSGNDWRLKQMSAGYGPYTLTRLCAETGGLYLLSEQARGYQFDPSQMRAYAPDYRPIRVIQSEILKNPAKAALVQAASMTYEDGGIQIPETVFRGYNDNILRQDLTEAQKPAAIIRYKLEQLHRILQAGESARDKITEARWRAAFDLAMGRILAMRVRLEGYDRMLAGMKANPKTFKNPRNNEWRLVAAQEIETGPQMRKAAQQARTYLKRVIDDHPDTPWAVMAERELSRDLGWTWTESERKLPGMQGQGNLSREEQIRLLLAEEERQREQRRRQREKPRNRPKL